MRLLEGYVENRTKEAALAAVLGALYFIVRSIKVPIAPPIILVDFSTVIYSTVCLVLSYPYVWLFSLLMGMTSTVPITVVSSILGLSVFYFIGKVVGLKRTKYLSFFTSTIIAVFDIVIFFWLLEMIPFTFMIPYLIKTNVQGVGALILVPVIISVLEKMGVIEV